MSGQTDHAGGLYDRGRRRHPKAKPKAVIVDCDGTLIDVSSVRHFVLRPKGEKDFDSFHKASIDCPPIPQAMEYCEKKFASGHAILVVTARMAKHQQVTREWLEKHMTVPYDGPFHAREDGDHNSDVSLKKRLYHYLSLNYSIRSACDDRPEVIELWKSLGLEVEQVPGWLPEEVN